MTERSSPEIVIGVGGRLRPLNLREKIAGAVLRVIQTPDGVETIDWQIADAVIAAWPQATAASDAVAGGAVAATPTEDELTDFLCDTQDRLGPGCDERALAQALLKTYSLGAAQPSRVTGACNQLEEAACLIWAELCPGMVMGDDDLPHYEAAAKAVLALPSTPSETPRSASRPS